MNYIDLIVAALLIFLAVKGFAKGLVIELASVAALILGIWGAIEFSFVAEDFLREELDQDREYLPLAAFAITFLGIVIGVHLLARILQRILKLTALSMLNRIGGAVFGLLKGVLILSFLFVFINSMGGDHFHLIKPETRNNSLTYPYLSLLGPEIIPVISESEWYRELELMPEDFSPEDSAEDEK